MRWRVRSDLVADARALAMESNAYKRPRAAVNRAAPCAGPRPYGTSRQVELVDRLQAYVATRLPHAQDVVVSSLDRIFGGGSRETYRFEVSYREGGRPVSRRLILRRDPPASLIETERR